MDFQVHELKWTPEKVTRFWNFQAQKPVHQGYFSKMVGDAIIQIARKYDALNGPALDYGAGPGYLTEWLLSHGIKTMACDISMDSLQILDGRLTRNPLFQGIHCLEGDTPLPTDTFGSVFLCETLEHLFPDSRRNIISSIRNALKEDGHIIITVPNDENLSAKTVFCADCGAWFHPIQHIASFTPRALGTLMEAHGFQTIFCEPVNFWSWTGAHRTLYRRGWKCLRRCLAKLKPAKDQEVPPMPNLIYVGRKMSMNPIPPKQ